jgi:transcriptional regulator with XRE-family HTH domain
MGGLFSVKLIAFRFVVRYFLFTERSRRIFVLSKGVILTKGRGGGKTPSMVVELLKRKVEEKSQYAVSKETGLGLATINSYLKGIGEPTTKTLEKLADYFGVSVSVLRGEGLLSEKKLTEYTGLTFDVNVNAYTKFVFFTQQEFDAALEDTGFFGTNIHFIHSTVDRANALLQLPEDFYNNIHPKIWLTLTQKANAIIAKYKDMLVNCKPEIRDYLLSLDKWKHENQSHIK